jgi:hypothetical protein
LRRAAGKIVSMTTRASDNSKKRLAAGDCGDFDPVFGAELPTIIGGRPPAPDNSKKRSEAERSGAKPPAVTTRPFGTEKQQP